MKTIAPLLVENRRRHRGIALVWIVITFVVLLGLVGLALDTARVLLAAHELQTAADAGALAGAAWVRTDQSQARLAARTITAANTAEKVAITLPDNPTNDAAGYVVLGRFDRDTLTFTATTSGANAIKVIAARSSSQNGELPLLFGPIFNASSSTVQRQAIAMVGGGTGAGLIALNRTAKGALTINGTVTVRQIQAELVDITGYGRDTEYTLGGLTIDLVSNRLEVTQ
jgi:Flp pilus assembly protein TadG